MQPPPPDAAAHPLELRALEAHSANEAGARASRQWEVDLAPVLRDPHGGLWRAHCDALNHGFVSRWLPSANLERALKTDLYDEAMGAGLFPLLATRAGSVVGIDVASNVVAAARERHPALHAVHADVRRLPFEDGTFDLVVSNSTLDHFDTRAEIETALRGIHRVMRKAGVLLITMDNAANPAVALRNWLPLSWLRRIGLVPYPIGVSCGPAQLQKLLGELGFEVRDVAAILHCPRAIAVARARRLQQRGVPEVQARFLRRLGRWERLGTLWTRFLTGYYVAICARKR